MARLGVLVGPSTAARLPSSCSWLIASSIEVVGGGATCCWYSSGRGRCAAGRCALPAPLARADGAAALAVEARDCRRPVGGACCCCCCCCWSSCAACCLNDVRGCSWALQPVLAGVPAAAAEAGVVGCPLVMASGVDSAALAGVPAAAAGRRCTGLGRAPVAGDCMAAAAAATAARCLLTASSCSAAAGSAAGGGGGGGWAAAPVSLLSGDRGAALLLTARRERWAAGLVGELTPSCSPGLRTPTSMLLMEAGGTAARPARSREPSDSRWPSRWLATAAACRCLARGLLNGPSIVTAHWIRPAAGRPAFKQGGRRRRHSSGSSGRRHMRCVPKAELSWNSLATGSCRKTAQTLRHLLMACDSLRACKPGPAGVHRRAGAVPSQVCWLSLRDASRRTWNSHVCNSRVGYPPKVAEEHVWLKGRGWMAEPQRTATVQGVCRSGANVG